MTTQELLEGLLEDILDVVPDDDILNPDENERIPDDPFVRVHDVIKDMFDNTINLHV